MKQAGLGGHVKGLLSRAIWSSQSHVPIFRLSPKGGGSQPPTSCDHCAGSAAEAEAVPATLSPTCCRARGTFIPARAAAALGIRLLTEGGRFGKAEEQFLSLQHKN